MKQVTQAKRIRRLSVGLCVLFFTASVNAIIVSPVDEKNMRVRIGSSGSGNISTVIYNAGLPAELVGLPGIATEPVITSTNVIEGGSGGYTVRIVTSVNRREQGNPAIATTGPITGRFYYDSSSPMTCVTPASCGLTSIPFTKISWEARDGDTLNDVLKYDGMANQIFQTQIESDERNNMRDMRHQNYYKFKYDNDVLLPAGVYEGRIDINADGVF